MPVLWTPGADANHKLVLRLTADDDACVPFAATETDEHHKPKAAKVRQFDFSELHKIQKIPLPKLHEGSADLSKLTPSQRATREKGFVYARVCMHEKCASTRMLRITDGLLPGEEDDDRREERRGRATAARTGAARRGGGPPVARANEVASGARRDIAAACIGVGGAAGGTRARECARRATHGGGFGQSSFLVFGSDPSVTV